MVASHHIAGNISGSKSSKRKNALTPPKDRDEKKLNGIVQNVLVHHGVSKPACVEVMPRSDEPRVAFNAFTTIQDKKVHVSYDPEYVPSSRAKKFCEQKGVVDGLEKCLTHIPGHECRHVENNQVVACPGSVEDHEEFFYEPMAKVLAPKGKDWALDDVTNLGEDLINNTLGSAMKEHAGLTLFYGNCGESIGWSQGMEFYMGVQQYSWCDEHDRWLLSPHFKHDAKVVKATREFIDWIEKRASKGKRATKEQLIEYFSNKKNWEDFSEEFAKTIEPFLKQNWAPPSCAHGKEMKETMKDSSVRKRTAKKYYDDRKKKPSWMKQTEALDAVYSIKAKDVPLIVEDPRRSDRFPIIPYQHKAYDERRDKVQQINFRKPIIIPQKETPFGIEGLTFGVAREHIDIPMRVKQSITSFPSFKQGYFDVSISMEEGIPDIHNPGSKIFIPWGDESKYHYSVLTRYGIIEYLARQGILPNVEISLGVFSTYNKIVRGLHESTELLLNPKFGSGTAIDIETFEQLAGTEKSVLFTSSDGHIQNWNHIKKRFIEIAKQHYYFHLQFGEPTEMTNDLRKAGLPAFEVNSGEDHYNLAIDLTRQQFDTYMKEYAELRQI